MKWSLKLILLVCCIWLNVSNNQVEGVIDEQCKVDCACCIARKCGPGQWTSKDCTLGCIDGHSSARCYELCTHNCTQCPDHVDTCTACYDGYYPGPAKDCTSQCLPGCKTCTSGTTCTSCKEGFNNDNGRNDCSNRYCPENCNCDNGQCTSCKVGYYDTSLSCNSVCPNNCMTVCLSGWSGQYCNISCSVGCKNQQCEKRNGECSNGCLDNFVGGQCNQCIPGKYGASCIRDCLNNCDEKGCLKDSGICINCNKNFAGEKCEKCAVGFYGSFCSKRCPTFCLNSVCDRDTGMCSAGCLDNYSGDTCCINNNNCITCLSDTRCKQCKSGYFNDQCDKQCPQNCLKACHIETGLCDGCKGNFYGESCNLSCASTCKTQTTTTGSICHRGNGKCLYGCVDGFHGLQCSEKCSVYCSDTLCEQDNGKCTKGCKMKVKNDPICPLTSDSSSSEQSVNTAAISFGTFFAVSLVVNIIFVVTLILRKYRKRVNDTYKAKGPVYENSGIEMECRNSANPGSAGKHGIEQATKSDPVLKSPDYEDLGRVQVSEHEYGEIRQDTRYH